MDSGNFEDGVFIGMLNTLLGGSAGDISKRTEIFWDAMKVFRLIEDDTATEDIEAPMILHYCGVDRNDASSNCGTMCINGTDAECPGMTLCFMDLEACAGCAAAGSCGGGAGGSGGINNSTTSGNINTDVLISNSTLGNTDSTEDTTADDTPMAMSVASSGVGGVPISSTIDTTNYCGASWGEASAACAISCAGGTDRECPPGQTCFGDIESCSTSTASVTSSQAVSASSGAGSPTKTTKSKNYCGVDWSDASGTCYVTCPGGIDAECPSGQFCFGDIEC